MPPRPSVDVMLLAPLCRDEIVGPNGSRQRAGGVGLYASRALARRGCRVLLHTPLARGDRDLLGALPERVEVVVHPSRATTRFRIEIDPGQPNLRRLTLLDPCDPLDPDRLGPLDAASYVLVGPLLPSDFDLGLRDLLRACSRPIDLGVQGLVRRAAPDGVITLQTLPALDLPPVRVLAGDEEEITCLADKVDTDCACEELIARGAEEVIMTRGDRGARITLRTTGERLEVAPVPPRRDVRHAVGLGDTFHAVYGWERHTGATPAEAGARAAQAATRLMEEGLPGLLD